MNPVSIVVSLSVLVEIMQQTGNPAYASQLLEGRPETTIDSLGLRGSVKSIDRGSRTEPKPIKSTATGFNPWKSEVEYHDSEYGHGRSCSYSQWMNYKDWVEPAPVVPALVTEELP